MRQPLGYHSYDEESWIFPHLLQELADRLILGTLILLFIATSPDPARAQDAAVSRSHATTLSSFAPIPGALYETTFRKDNVEIFSEDGDFLGLVGKIGRPTGLAFDSAGNLFVASDDSTAGYSIKKVSATDGTIRTFTTAGLSGPHGLAFDQEGNLYVANYNNNTVTRYTPRGRGETFADRGQGLVNPLGLVFDAAGNLLVTNQGGGPMRAGRVMMLSPTGDATILVKDGLQVPYGIALDATGNVYVSNNGGNFVEKFAPDGTDLGVFCSAGCSAPQGMIFDDAGNLYVANNNTATIEKYAPDGTDLGAFTSTRGGPHFLAIYKPR